MTARFVLLEPSHADELAAWLCSDRWPHHGVAEPSLEVARGWVESGRFGSESSRAHWIEVAGERVGLVNLEELDDPTPTFDLRIRSAHRRAGLGRLALAWLAEQAFVTHGKHRVEGHTRADNVGMRGLFHAAGWVQEAYYRRAWPDAAGAFHDATAYALLRDDWRARTTTPLPAGEPVPSRLGAWPAR